MRMLLDTHAFLWWIANDKRLSRSARQSIEDRENEVFVSAASAWEIAVKCRLGKLTLPASPEQFVSKQMAQNQFSSLSISVSHALHVHSLKGTHRDPFDLILIAQSALEQIPIVTADQKFNQYKIETIW